MPELPEVETLRRELAKVLPGREIKSVSVLTPKTVSPLSVRQFTSRLRGQKIISVERRAKILLISFQPGRLVLAIHLKMTGQLVFSPQGSTLKPAKVEPLIVGGHPEDPKKYTRAIISFVDGSELRFNDLRRFGWLRLLESKAVANLHKHHGLEPLSSDFTIQTLRAIFNQYPKRILKALLLDQTLIAGLGNIYVDESCFAARIKPDRRVATLTPAEKLKLYRVIRSILTLAIKHGGTSARDYRRSDGSRGGFAAYLKVYGRAGQPCKNCRTLIVKIKLTGRGTHYCPRCQR